MVEHHRLGNKCICVLYPSFGYNIRRVMASKTVINGIAECVIKNSEMNSSDNKRLKKRQIVRYSMIGLVDKAFSF